MCLERTAQKVGTQVLTAKQVVPITSDFSPISYTGEGALILGLWVATQGGSFPPSFFWDYHCHPCKR